MMLYAAASPDPVGASAQGLSQEFTLLATEVIHDLALHHPDPAVRRALQEEPIYLRTAPTPEERAAIAPAPPPTAIVLGIHHGAFSADLAHHFIMLYEAAIRQAAAPRPEGLPTQLVNTVLHEVDHHLGRNHTLPSVLTAATLWTPPGG